MTVSQRLNGTQRTPFLAKVAIIFTFIATHHEINSFLNSIVEQDMSDDSETESETERDPENECSICLKGMCKRSTTPCQHSFCYKCLLWAAQGSLKVNAAGRAEAKCPMCRRRFGSFKHHVNRTYKLYPPGQGLAGPVVKYRRRVRKRRRPKKNGGDAGGQPK